ncbi:DUF6455 family protein [Phaeobacter gallaeciensis]|uniref:DUF6455 domain-containing protein n=1 Tax=Phaeobacter gallaeciensis TaxID=60890 RepID=A0AAC9Z7Q4_9RHOB|nr:DUF6455 family protein [Phaeobacter gallaeciensis]AHD08727.1 hypothetical protein Gal_00953 [Phaeobacter gallaeciensis DSM 26640]ATE91993.1 hypothetical protein PhaeoP11_00948 [Phaeobacter gallaeciensis]ATE98183.1 hypothetical protein PhaeoP73_02896 [Phaeobacter gallaeciensis]ATF00609.1 hypothetical protein PhaeoP75_00949 [Phaeobacter gallaeciensis]ATF05040.1 hypothetical protein PhaeoP63_00948 [Phaeobacter gallaeciensis]
MHPLGHPLHHLRLIKRMGQACGVDLPASFAAGQITQTDWADMVTRCRGCREVARCEAFLDQIDRAADTMPKAPLQGCRNGDALLRLRD